jgi:hypothetical protein
MLNNGDITISADVSDAAGNPATKENTRVNQENHGQSVSLYTNLEIDDVVNGTEDETVTVSGTSTGVEEGQTVLVRLSDGTTHVDTTATVSANGTWSATDADISMLNNGDITISADVSDAAGNQATQATAIVTLDNQASFEGLIIGDAATQIDALYSNSQTTAGTAGSGDKTAQVVLDISAVDETDGVELWIDGVKVFEDTVSADDIANGQLNTGEIDFSQHDSENDQSVNLEVKVTHNGEYVQDNGDTTWEYQW